MSSTPVEGSQIKIPHDVVGYYVKSCGVQMSVSIPARKRGYVHAVKDIEVFCEIDGIPQHVWIPKDKVEVIDASNV